MNVDGAAGSLASALRDAGMGCICVEDCRRRPRLVRVPYAASRPIRCYYRAMERVNARERVRKICKLWSALFDTRISHLPGLVLALGTGLVRDIHRAVLQIGNQVIFQFMICSFRLKSLPTPLLNSPKFPYWFGSKMDTSATAKQTANQGGRNKKSRSDG